MSFKEMTKEQLIIELKKLIKENENLKSQLSEKELAQTIPIDISIIDYISEAIFIQNEHGIFIDVNEGAVKMYGYSKKELIGASPDIIAAPEKNNLNTLMNLMKIAFLTGETQQTEFWAKRWNGDIILNDIIFNKGNHLGKEVIIATARDITERKLNEERFREQNENLEKINAEKDKFFSIIAHDLRSPFNGFLGLTEIMADKLMLMSVNEIQKHASIMKSSASNLYRLLENLLEWSRMQKGVTQYKPEVFALSKVVNECIKTSIDQAKTKDITFEVDIHDKLFVFADIHMVETIFRNLTSNAVKYSQRGGKIWITTMLNEENFVEIAIRDNGIGMNQEIVDNLFRIDRNIKRNGTEGEPSSGLGLILCKDFIEKNRGRIRVESKVNEGSTFSFTLPMFFTKKTEKDATDLMGRNSTIQES
jgi:PAS domain S-box-containing protein